uniref:SFRICE_000949 n=1 Tax=Spodoptera frugiperda TaxID=7108 RepID=A0A2H1VMJ9_SPOFR
MSDLPATEVARAVTMIDEGHTYRSVSRTVGVSVSVIHRCVKRYRQTGSYVRRRGQGRKRATNAVEERFIRVQTLRNRRQTAVQTRNLLEEVRNARVSERTVRRRLNECGLKSYVPGKAPKLEASHRVARLTFARQHQD